MPDWDDAWTHKRGERTNTDNFKIRAMRNDYLMEHDGIEAQIATDVSAMKFFMDYWTFVRWNEHGNEANLGDEVTFGDFVDMVLCPEPTYDYLMPDGYEWADERERELAQRLETLSKKYAQKE